MTGGVVPLLARILRGGAGLALLAVIAAGLSFVILRTGEGDAIAILVQDGSIDPGLVDRITCAFGLDRPWPEQLFAYLGALLGGDFGRSILYGGDPVAPIVLAALPATLTVATIALAIALPSGLAAGTVAARCRGTAVDGAVAVASAVAVALPAAVVAWLLARTFGVVLGWLPTAGWGAPSHLVLPALTVAVAPAAAMARLTRVHVLDRLGADHVRTARAKGLSDRDAVIRHVLPHAAAPLAASAAVIVGTTLTSGAIVEIAFGVPGLARLGTDAVLARDHVLAAACVLAYVLCQGTATLIADLVGQAVDPRPGLRDPGW